MKRVSSFLLLLSLACHTGISRAADDDDPPAPRNPAELMKAVNMKPLTMAPGSRTMASLYSEYTPWLKRVLLEPMKKKTATHARGADAAKLGDDIITFLYKSGRKDSAQAAEFLKQSQAIVAAGVADPLLLWLASKCSAIAVPDTSTRKELLEKAYAKLRGTGYSAFLSAVVCGELCNTRAVESDQNELLIETAEALIAAKNEAGTFQGDEARWYIDYTFMVFEQSFENSHVPLMEKVYGAPPSFPEWARETLAGKHEINLAWKDRGGGWASSVPDKGWVGFAEHLTRARTHLVKAWTLNPKEPYAAYKMISVTGGGHGGPGDTLRLWLDRSNAATFDYTNSYKQYLNFTRPRWGGSFEEMAAFGLACAETRKFDTQVPEMLLEALDRIAADAESPAVRKRLFSDPTIAPAVSFTCEQYIKQASSTADRAFWQSRLALYGWLAGDYARAAGAIKQLQGRMDPAVARTVRAMHLDTATLLADCAVATAGESKNMEGAIALYEKRSYAEARNAFTALGKKAGADVQPVMRRWIELIDIEERFRRGEAVTLTADADLSQWTHTFGNWKGGPGGALISTGWDGQGRIFHRARFGDRVEFQADVTFSDPVPKGQGIALALCGRRFNTDGFAWNACALMTTADDDAINAAILYTHQRSSPPLELSPLADLSKIRLTARCADKTLSFKVNDWIAFNKQEAHRNNKASTAFLYPADGYIGFSYPNFMSGQTITIRNMTVKRVP